MKSPRTIHAHATTHTPAHPPIHAPIHSKETADSAEEKPEVAAVPASSATPTAPAPVVSSRSATLVFIPPPPATPMPKRPDGWTPRAGEDYRGTQPKSAELSTLSSAIDDLKRFAAEYASVLGTTAPPLDHVLQLFEAGNAWSASRVATASWDVYARAREGLAWGGIRVAMDTLRPAFDLAVKGNASLATQLPGLASLLGVQKVIARKGASTRRANKADEAEGKPATHGKVGKARKNAAAKAALAASTQPATVASTQAATGSSADPTAATGATTAATTTATH